MTRKINFEFTITGFVIGLILVSMTAAALGTFMSKLQEEYDYSGDNTLLKYNQTSKIVADAEEIRDATDIEQQSGVLDVIGGFFTSGYAALKVAFGSFDLFSDLMTDATEDVEALSFFSSYLIAIILIGIFLGVAVAVLVKRSI